jgi:hypothetical protein
VGFLYHFSPFGLFSLPFFCALTPARFWP